MGQQRVRWETLPDLRRKLLLQDLADGYSYQFLAEKHKIDKATIGRWVERYSLPRPTQRVTGYEKLLDLKAAVVRDYLEEGVNMRELKYRFGVHEGTMRTFLQTQGLLKSRGAQAGIENPQSKGRTVGSKDRDAGKYWARRAVESALGQRLPTGWVIHHMNECPTDQTLSNLWLFRSMSDHSLYHQRQRENLTTGGQRSPSRLAKDTNGLWLPETLDRLESEPGKELHTL
jgi:transposase